MNVLQVNLQLCLLDAVRNCDKAVDRCFDKVLVPCFQSNDKTRLLIIRGKNGLAFNNLSLVVLIAYGRLGSGPSRRLEPLLRLDKFEIDILEIFA